MNREILNFRKTEHFMKRQWERVVDEKHLQYVLKWVLEIKYKKEILVVCPEVFSLPNLSHRTNKYLVVVIKSNALITCYWCKHLECIIRKEKEVRYQLLDVISRKNHNTFSKLKVTTLF